MLTGYADTGALDPRELERLRNESRYAREELESAVVKLPGEPRGDIFVSAITRPRVRGGT